MSDKIEKSRLNDYYGGLLNTHQSEMLRMYYDCDMSLSEISEVTGTTRQGAGDVINRATGKLENYEEKLGLISKVDGIAGTLEEIISEMEDSRHKTKLQDLLKKIKEI